jgi:hypothetical protein
MRSLTGDEEERAQHLACSHLVKGCEAALSELSGADETEGQPHTKRRAEEILRQVLSSWSHTMNVVAPSHEQLLIEGDLDEWTSDELLAEALTRRAGDEPALRLMQGQTLTAQLAAHDRRSAQDGRLAVETLRT